ncbi:MAG: cytochrome c peroxidase [Gammaproteobacteria bacterium]|jgi:cytochrome c peroxidase|nr:cytochrome c peroxidase [Gammaproteobacteria bacterium]MDP6615633.1 cytochrome c peroxidase [Gammaproteobacteria bacterium]MDP6696080.1 cytochrome c peroxidase [Gammaproteobacteria bacterium]
MKSSFAITASLSAALLATAAVAQFIETPAPPPPSAKGLDLPVVLDTISGLPLVDEATPDGANGFIKDEQAAIVLGKALFWDMQAGSDEVACATCHYHAGADNRQRNQLSPGLKGGNNVFDPTRTGKIGPNNKLRPRDFPFHELADPADRDSAVLFDTDDVTSSSGAFFSAFNDVIDGDPIDDCTPITPDPVGFHINGINTRRVEPRNTPTTINAAFNHRNFWDGRANNIFNGVDPFGQRNTAARVRENQGGSVVQIQIALQNSSLASQAVGPPLSDFEMSCAGRVFPDIGQKLLTLKPLGLQKVHKKDSVLGPYKGGQPLALQKVHKKDSVLGPYKGKGGQRGLNVSYQALIEAAISDRFWDYPGLVDGEHTLTEANFAMIWGLAIQSYVRTLVSDDAPYDQWAEAPGGRSPVVTNTKGILTESQMRGMDLFFSNTIGERGNCVTCHQGPLFTTATFPFTEEAESGEFPEREQLVERMRRGDGFNVAENLFRYFIHGEGTVAGFTLEGRAGSWELPNIYSATVGGDMTLNGDPCKITSFLMNQDRVAGAPDGNAPGPADPLGPPRSPPPEPPGPSDHADYTTRDVVIRMACFPPPVPEFEITIVDNGPGPGDTISLAAVVFEGVRPPFPGTYPFFPGAEPVIIPAGVGTGDFTLEMPTLYDTAFYNIGVRPTAEDPGIGASDGFGNPLSFTQQWIDSLLGMPGADVDALNSLNFARVKEPFSWLGDAVFFPGGFDGYAWLTHRQEPNSSTNPNAGAGPYWGDPPECRLGFGGPPHPSGATNQADCESAFPPGGVWFIPAEFVNAPQFFPPKPGRGDDAVPAYSPFNMANYDAIMNMPTALDGAFKVPTLRNVSLTGPFFHNGGHGTLRQVVEFYNRGGDFAIENLGDLAPNIDPLGLDDQQIDDLVAFLEALTDDRVRCKRAPFDHPEIILPEGHKKFHKKFSNGMLKDDGSGQGKDRTTVIRQVGAKGTKESKCLLPFMKKKAGRR